MAKLRRSSSNNTEMTVCTLLWPGSQNRAIFVHPPPTIRGRTRSFQRELCAKRHAIILMVLGQWEKRTSNNDFGYLAI